MRTLFISQYIWEIVEEGFVDLEEDKSLANGLKQGKNNTRKM